MTEACADRSFRYIFTCPVFSSSSPNVGQPLASPIFLLYNKYVQHHSYCNTVIADCQALYKWFVQISFTSSEMEKEIGMEFGKWVQNKRKERKLDIRTLAEKTDVDVGTISRIENLHTNATVYTALSLIDGLGVSLPTLIYDLTGNHPPSIKDKYVEKNNTVLTLQDVERLVKAFEHSRDSVRKYLVDTLNDISSNIPKGMNISYGGGAKPATFTIEDVDKLVLSFCSPLYEFKVRYPSGIGLKNIELIYEQNGALVSDDIQQYMQRIRLEGLKRTSSNLLLRLTGSGDLQRIKLNELLALDEELGEGGRLLGLFWEVYRFDKEFDPPIHHSKFFEPPTLVLPLDIEEWETVRGRKPWVYSLALLYVLVYRWYLYLNRRGIELSPFRKYG